MDVRRKLQKLERKISGIVEDTISKLTDEEQSVEPLAIERTVLEDVVQRVRSGARGRLVFPFDSITLTVVAPTADARADCEAVFDEGAALPDRVVQKLRAAGCTVESVEVHVKYVKEPQSGWPDRRYHLQYARMSATARGAKHQSGPGHIELTVLEGVASQRTYSLATTHINIGRCDQIRDARNRLIRTNQVAFSEDAPANLSVSRRHAHIAYDAASRSVRLYDDGSEHGTAILRHGASTEVPKGNRGVRLSSGDDIVLGEARLRVKLEPG